VPLLALTGVDPGPALSLGGTLLGLGALLLVIRRLRIPATRTRH
jgi:hypothetical protein